MFNKINRFFDCRFLRQLFQDFKIFNPSCREQFFSFLFLTIDTVILVIVENKIGFYEKQEFFYLHRTFYFQRFFYVFSFRS